MVLYGIPDIRLFWSRDTGFLSQFAGVSPSHPVQYQPISVYPQLYMDLSFWLPPSPENPIENDVPPPQGDNDETVAANVYDVVRNVGGDLVELVSIIVVYFIFNLLVKSGRYN
jgi:phenylalanyl-tRNA synthetase alpha chain